MDPHTQSLFSGHLATLKKQWQERLHQHQFEGALVAAGTNTYYFDDDQSPPFHANPHFLRWTVADNSEHCVLLLNGNEHPRLLWYTPADFWYLPSSVPAWLTELFDCQSYSTLSALESNCMEYLKRMGRVAYFGTNPSRYCALDNVENAPLPLSNQLAFQRGFKTPFEIEQIAHATETAVRGHLVAYEQFCAGASEFDIHIAYQAEIRHAHHDLPYPSIVALNSHSSTLHYQHYDRVPPTKRLSFLIDAGARFRCYHSDITRTYSADPDDEFATLVQRTDHAQQSLVEAIPSMNTFIEFHERAHQAMADVLVELKVVKCSVSATVEQKLSDVFYPHGTGHLLGLQTHDVGGHIVHADGTEGKPPARFPSLRLIREIENNLVFTVEPGIYFIPVLLDTVRGHKDVNWELVDRLVPFGGVRIEDNVLVSESGVRNFTREAFTTA